MASNNSVGQKRFDTERKLRYDNQIRFEDQVKSNLINLNKNLFHIENKLESLVYGVENMFSD